MMQPPSIPCWSTPPVAKSTLQTRAWCCLWAHDHRCVPASLRYGFDTEISMSRALLVSSSSSRLSFTSATARVVILAYQLG